uniref:Uncharacterized protein n=1 Tax=Dictyoglomus turgidum TaxID=513050 RepID=A0A7C3WVR2_9BACT
MPRIGIDPGQGGIGGGWIVTGTPITSNKWEKTYIVNGEKVTLRLRDRISPEVALRMLVKVGLYCLAKGIEKTYPDMGRWASYLSRFCDRDPYLVTKPEEVKQGSLG